MGREDLIGNGKKHLIPSFQPAMMGAIRQSDGSTFKSNKPLPAKKYRSLPKSFNNMKNGAVKYKN